MVIIEKGITLISNPPGYIAAQARNDLILFRIYEIIEAKVKENQYYDINSICLPRPPEREDDHPQIEDFLLDGGYSIYEEHGRGGYIMAGYGDHGYGPTSLSTPPHASLNFSDYLNMRHHVYSNPSWTRTNNRRTITGMGEPRTKLRTMRAILLDPYMSHEKLKGEFYFGHPAFTAYGRELQTEFWQSVMNQRASLSEHFPQYYESWRSLAWTAQLRRGHNTQLEQISGVCLPLIRP